MITGGLLCPKVEAMLAAQNGRHMRKIPLITASHPRTVTTTHGWATYESKGGAALT
jgi:hypothetical protein